MSGVLALEPIGGIAGDMTIAALLDLGAPRAALDEGLAALKQAAKPDEIDLRGVEIVERRVVVGGLTALHVDVVVPQATRDRDAHHRPWAAIRALLEAAKLPDGARRLALAAFQRLAEAEGRIHSVPPDDVEFHEVGAVDSIVDVTGSALLVDALGPTRIVCLPLPSGGGQGQSAHGPIPFPAPATLDLLRGHQIRPTGPGERVTPTGAALVAAWTESVDALPAMRVEKVGHGAGTKRWSDAPNLLRATLGADGRDPAAEDLLQLEANLDDLNPQLVAVALAAAIEAGAVDAWIAPVTMKKGRPGHLLGALVPAHRRAAVEAVLFRETTTLGIRAFPISRTILDRELVEVATRYGPIRIKLGRRHGTLLNAAPEFEDCAAAAREHGVPVKEVIAAAISAFRK